MSEFSIITVGRTPIGRARSSWRRPFLKQSRHVLALLMAAPFLAGAVATIALCWRDMPPAHIHTGGPGRRPRRESLPMTASPRGRAAS
jgi:hypothetical protein